MMMMTDNDAEDYNKEECDDDKKKGVILDGIYVIRKSGV
jgi:hypothetical protein